MSPAEFLRWADRELDFHRRRLVNFAGALQSAAVDGDPTIILSNSDAVAEDAAKVQVFSSCVAWVRIHETSLDTLLQRAIENSIRGARRGTGSRSTSTTSNWMAQCQAAAWAEVATALGGLS